MKSTFNESERGYIVLSEKKYEKSQVAFTVKRIASLISDKNVNGSVIGVMTENPVLCMAAVYGISCSGNSAYIMNPNDGAYFNEYVKSKKSIDIVLYDEEILQNTEMSEIVSNGILIENDVQGVGEESIELEAKISIVPDSTFLDVKLPSLSEEGILAWKNFNQDTIKVSLAKRVILYSKEEAFYPFYWMDFLLSECQIEAYDVTGKSQTEILEILRNRNESTCCMSASLLKSLEYHLISLKDVASIFTSLITYGNDVYDFLSLKDYLKSNKIRWYNYFGNEYFQMVSTIKKLEDEKLYQAGKEIKGCRLAVKNAAGVPMPLGVPGIVYAQNDAYQNANEWKTYLQGKRTEDGILTITGLLDNLFFYKGHLCSLNYLEEQLVKYDSSIKVKMKYENGTIIILYAGTEDFDWLQKLEFEKKYVPAFYPELNWVLQKSKIFEKNNFNKLWKMNRIPDSNHIKKIEAIVNNVCPGVCHVDVFTEDNSVVLRISLDEQVNGTDNSQIYQQLDNEVCIYFEKYNVLVDNLIIRAGQKEEYRVSINDKYQLTEEQNDVLNIWKDVLGCDEIGLDDSFYDLGGNSALFVQLVSKLSSYRKKDIPVAKLMGIATVRSSFKVLEMDGISIDILQEERILKDTIPDPYLKNAEDARVSEETSYNNILLTGANGFLGTYILKELISKTNAKIYCLTRGQNKEHAFKRIMDSMIHYKQEQYMDKNRVIPVVGDFGKEHLGLDEANYNELCELIDVVIHNGACANFVYSYEMLENDNVTGTGRILEFASTKKKKAVQFISSVAIYGPLKKDAVVDEEYPLMIEELPRIGYARSKWAADSLVLNARDVVPSNTFRIGNVVGDGVNGICQSKDFWWILIKFGIEMKKFPKYYKVPFPLCTIDSVADAIVRIVMNKGTGHTYHMISDKFIMYDQMLEWLKADGFEFEIINYYDWIACMREHAKTLDNAIFSSVPDVIDVEEDLDAEVDFINTDNSFTRNTVEELGGHIQELDEEIFRKHIEYFIESKFIKDSRK